MGMKPTGKTLGESNVGMGGDCVVSNPKEVDEMAAIPNTISAAKVSPITGKLCPEVVTGAKEHGE